MSRLPPSSIRPLIARSAAARRLARPCPLNAKCRAAIPTLLARQKSSSASIWNLPMPESVRDAVKSSFLKEAAKPDSNLWSGTNGSHRSTGNDHDHYDIDSSSLAQDPLKDWYLDRKTSYWPTFPSAIRPLEQGADPFQLAKGELDSLSSTIRQDLLGTEHPVLHKAASYFFESTADGGKKVRPLMVLLMSRALADTMNGNTTGGNAVESSFWTSPFSWQRQDLPRAQRRLAEISELIHTASLFHDDVIDGADTRRSVPAVHKVFGNKMAILAGDYLLARASISLARLRHADVIETMSTIIEHLVRGEVMQLKGHGDDNSSQSSVIENRMIYYLRKNFYKTGSLMANSCKSAALLGNYPDELVDSSYRYGKHIGMAFQLVDDVLDFEGIASAMGKPSLSDLNAGIATAPVLFAAEKYPSLMEMMERKFREEGDVASAVEMVNGSDGIEQTKEMARVHAELAVDAVMEMGDGAHRDSLAHLAYKVVDRTR